MDFDPGTCCVALLAGGKSNEREISLASGQASFEALAEVGFTPVMLDPADPDDLKCLIDGPFDVAFLAMHGKFGEDGTLQGVLELIGLPYTGSGIWSSATSMDKSKTKMIYERAGLRTPSSVTLTTSDNIDTHMLVDKLGHHCVVKPATAGSAIGVHIVEGERALAEAIAKVKELDREVVVERYIKGRELTCAVLGNENPRALPVIEIVAKNDFYDYESKYVEGGSRHICPAELDESTAFEVASMAISAHKALCCRGVSRSDVILDEDGLPWLLETNSIPGMTATSLLPDAARAAGISFPELCRMLIEFALE